MLSFFAAQSSGIPLAAEPVFHVGPLVVTNAMLFGVLTGIAVLWLYISAARRTGLRPKSKFAFAVETVVEFFLNTAIENFNDRKKAVKHLPLLMTLFTFILFANVSGLFPGIGTVVVNGNVPLLRSFTTDLNATLALAILTIGTVQFYAIKELGILGHIKHYFTSEPWKPMNLFIGTLEVMTEFIRVMTLSLRLFGVIYAGEVLLHAIGDLTGAFGWAATLPIYFLEIFFSVIQAYLFVMLTIVYLSIATAHSDDGAMHEEIVDRSNAEIKTAAEVVK